MPLSRRIVSGVETHKDQWLNDAVSRLAREIADELILSYGSPTRTVYSNYTAKLGELVRLDPSGGAFTVNLPAFGRKDEGKSITICNISGSANTVTIGANDGTVNGLASVTVSKSKFVRQAVAIDADSREWLLTTVLDGATSSGDSPFWEWNGTDLSQFDTKSEGGTVTSSSVVYTTHAGVGWIQFTVTAPSNVNSAWEKCVILPIDVTPPSADYKIEYDMTQTNDGGNLILQGACVRYASGRNCYGGIHNDAGDDIAVGLVVSGVQDATDYREEPRGVPYNASHDMDRCSLYVRGDAAVFNSQLGVGVGRIDTSGTITAAGQPGLVAGVSSGGPGATTIVALFSNIKCWEVT